MSIVHKAIPLNGGGAALNFEIVGGACYSELIMDAKYWSVENGEIVGNSLNAYGDSSGDVCRAVTRKTYRPSEISSFTGTFNYDGACNVTVLAVPAPYEDGSILYSNYLDGESGSTESFSVSPEDIIYEECYIRVEISVTAGSCMFQTSIQFSTSQKDIPANPKENTIWVSTDTPINGYVFSAETPTEYQGQTSLPNGLIWVKIGTSSPVSFKIVNGLDIFTYPILVNQFIDGNWEAKTARTYLGGEWINWETWFFKDGDQCMDITGGWNILTYGSNRGDAITMDSGNLTLSGNVTSTAHSVVQTNLMVDVTNLTSIDFIVSDWSWTNPGSAGNYAFTYTFGLATTQQNADSGTSSLTGVVKSIVRKRADTTEGAQTVSLDVSDLQGKYYLFMDFYNYYIIYSCTITGIKGVTTEANTIDL